MTAKSKWTGRTEAEIAALSAKNRAAQVSGVKNSHPPVKVKKVAKTQQDVPTESQEQQAVITWWNDYAPKVGLDARLLVAIPNGSVLAGDAGRRAMQSARLKREGMRVGYPDLQLDVMRSGYGGLKIEMKRVNWRPRVSDKHYAVQEEYLFLIWNQGYFCATCQGAKSAISCILEYLSLGKP